MSSVSELGEEALVAQIISSLPQGDRVIAGPGDDCAVVKSEDGRWQLLKTDCVVEGVHFFRGTDPQRVGGKAIKRVLSDIAAMGGAPREAVVTLALDEAREVSEVLGWMAGMKAVAVEYGCSIVGGETTRLPGQNAMISIAMTGVVEPAHCVLRSGAKVGDQVWVTGRLGGSLESERHLDFVPRLREAAWLVEHGFPTAMMDLSDGLGSDLPRLAAASGCGYAIDQERIPCHEGVGVDAAIGDGEDYELLFTVSPDRSERLATEWAEAFPNLALTCIGEMREETPLELQRGWEHYRSQKGSANDE